MTSAPWGFEMPLPPEIEAALAAGEKALEEADQALHRFNQLIGDECDCASCQEGEERR